MDFGELRTTLRYVPLFRDRTFVIAVDGAVVAQEEFSNFLMDIVILRELGVRIVLVVGAEHQIRRLADARGLDVQTYSGSGVTDESAMEVSVDAISRLASDVTKWLSALNIRAASANVLTVHRAGVVGGVDLQLTGRVGAVDGETLNTLLDQGLLPFITPLGYDNRGRALRMNGSVIAGDVGIELKASKIIYVCRDAVYGPLRIARQYSIADVEALFGAEQERIPEELAVRWKTGVRACKRGVPRVHFVPGNHASPILAELFSSEGIGTMIYADDYVIFREASPSDVDAMLSMMRHAMEDALLVARTREQVQEQLDDFWVLEIDSSIVGCAALHRYEEESQAEIASLFISAEHKGRGYGQTLISRLEEVAKKEGMDRVFALSTQSADFFLEQCGYQESEDIDWMAAARREIWQSNRRNSRLIWKAVK